MLNQKIIKMKCSQVYENIKKENMDGEKKKNKTKTLMQGW